MSALRIRVAAVCSRGDSLLLVEHEKDSRRYWLLPGGGMKAGETAEAALQREVLEETSMSVDVGPLICICETIFPDEERHIVHFIYQTSASSGLPGPSSDPRVRGSSFVPISDLGGLDLRPPLQDWLVKYLAGEKCATPDYLGALWT